MGFLDGMNFDDTIEPKAVVAGEYELRISDIVQDVNKNGDPYILPKFEIIGEVGSKTVTRYMALPVSTMDDDKMNKTKLGLKRFFEALGADVSGGIELETLIGETLWAILGVEEDAEYGEGNYIKRFVAGK